LSERAGYDDWTAAVIAAVEVRQQAPPTEPDCVAPPARRRPLELAQLAVRLRPRLLRARPGS
jgi:hypothetical protein